MIDSVEGSTAAAKVQTGYASIVSHHCHVGQHIINNGLHLYH